MTQYLVILYLRVALMAFQNIFRRKVRCGCRRKCEHVQHIFPAAGIIPWNATPGKACGSTLSDICNTNEVRARLWLHVAVITHDVTVFNCNHLCPWLQFYLSYHLYIVACAGAGATVIALVRSPPLCPSSPFNRVCTDRPRQLLLSSFPWGLWVLLAVLSSIRCPICIAAHGRLWHFRW